MKSTLFVAILAVGAAALMPLAAASQVAPESQTPPPAPVPMLKYEVMVGYAYSTLNQVNQSRYGLQGVQVAVSRDWGKHFALTAVGDEYRWGTSQGNPGKPVIDSLLIGPDFRANIYGPVDGFFRGLIGAEHTGGESETPDWSFAGGIGGGLQIAASRHIAVRISGDRIGASFSVANNTSSLAYSPHLTWNTRANVGVVYRF
ncbi:MAG TPA: hypothetical protein VMA34_02000 [Terracidiphilus sp.]|nr:hypothetical protein [Terracidiphilus sp.]